MTVILIILTTIKPTVACLLIQKISFFCRILKTICQRLTKTNGYSITLILQQIFIFSYKVKLEVGKNKWGINPLNPICSPPTGWTNWQINDVHFSNLNWRQFFPCHNIHVYYISIIDKDLYLAGCGHLRRRISDQYWICMVSYYTWNNFI